MAKFFVKLALRSLDVLGIIALARLIVTKMALNSNFEKPDPPLADITNAANKLAASKAAVDVAKTGLAQAVSVQDDDETALQDLLTSEGRYVDNRAKGEKAIIESAGMHASDEPSPVGELPRVENLSLSRGDNPGEVDAHWNPVANKKNYTVQSTPDPIVATAWTTKGNPTKSSFTITGLVSASKVWVRVCANGTAGAGAFSDPAFIVVP